METKTIISVFVLFVCFTCSCSDFDRTDTLQGGIDSSQVDSLIFTYQIKPDYGTSDYYPLLKLSFNASDSSYDFYSDSTLIISSVLSADSVDSLSNLLSNVGQENKNKIYNAHSFWAPELELKVYCKREDENFMIMSFGKHVDNPETVRMLYGALLRLTSMSQKNG